ncbi:helix-turn-helix transcriptional regulator [Hominibacterium faecale]|uniref:helix-turn-helix transcriptional regulator n=1 Tax=Hominibacterium faecale TaxID=2839743 RepID=UPI0022B2AB2B|nr:AraC family transcriptional regulator [Hominibacterium faecale]
MLPEQINYEKNLPFAIGFSNVAKEPPHYHREMEMALILRGTASYRIHHQKYQLSAGDVIIVDTEDLHRIDQSSEDVLMLTMYVDLEFFNDLYPNIDFMIFACEECARESTSRHQQLQNKVAFLRHHLAEIMTLTASREDNSQLLMEKIHQFIFLMVNQFQGFFIEDNQFKTSHNEVNSIDLDRLYRIIKYIYLNYDQKITLDDLAELEHLSPYYVSHLIKETSGLSFQNFLNYVRVEYAEKFLAENKLTLTQISEFCGFSSPSYFNKCFKTWHHLTPSQYRKQLQLCERALHKDYSQTEALALLKPYLNAFQSKQRSKVQNHASHHMFLPVRTGASSFGDFQSNFSLRIFVDSVGDLARLGYCWEKLRPLAPQALGISAGALQAVPCGEALLSDLLPAQIQPEIWQTPPDLRNTPAATISEAFASILEDPDPSIRLFGESCALFTNDGLPSPYYTIYSLFAGLRGSICERREQYLLVSHAPYLFILLYQTDAAFALSTHLHFHNFQGDVQVIEQRFGKEHSPAAMLEALGSPQEITKPLKEHIWRAASGETQFFQLKCQLDPRLDLDIPPNTFVLLSFKEG